ncbi:PP2C family protein-serine/threonine phosphatase [Acidobacteriota bacterium]
MNLHSSGFPKINEMEFAASFVPSAFGSGDIYNIFQLDDKNIGLYNIDVSGHGFAASLFSVSLKQRLDQDPKSNSLLRIPQIKEPYYSINSPQEVAGLLDKEDMLGKYGRFITMVYAVVDIEVGLVAFYRAGHNLPLVVHDHCRSEFIQGGGAPIGLGLDLGRKEGQEFRLSPGDQFILFSDGISDAYSPKLKSRYGLDRLRQVLTDQYRLSLRESFEFLINDVQDFVGKDNFSDDISIIGFKWLGEV